MALNRAQLRLKYLFGRKEASWSLLLNKFERQINLYQFDLAGLLFEKLLSGYNVFNIRGAFIRKSAFIFKRACFYL